MPSHPSFWLLFTLLALPALAELPDVVESVGQYGSDYLSDWSDLPTGDQLARHDLAGLTFQAVSGETARRSWQGQDEVRLTASPSGCVDRRGQQEPTTLFTIRSASAS